MIYFHKDGYVLTVEEKSIIGRKKFYPEELENKWGAKTPYGDCLLEDDFILQKQAKIINLIFSAKAMDTFTAHGSSDVFKKIISHGFYPTITDKVQKVLFSRKCSIKIVIAQPEWCYAIIDAKSKNHTRVIIRITRR